MLVSRTCHLPLFRAETPSAAAASLFNSLDLVKGICTCGGIQSMSYDLIFPFCDLKNFFSLKIIIKKNVLTQISWDTTLTPPRIHGFI